MSTQPVDRPASRVILIGPDGRTLLMRGGDPARPEDGTWWFTPGGAVDPGETFEEAARRELWEETGLVDVEWGALVARRKAVFSFLGTTFRAIEHFYVAYTPHFEVAPTGLTAIEEESTEEFRWVDARGIDGLVEPVYPTKLSEVLPGLGARRYPSRPWSWGD